MTTEAPFGLRRGDDRGTTDLGWLHSRHSFSFGAWRDPARMGFRSLRVLNDDVVAPGDLQVMTAGRGIRHSEMNPSDTERVHFLQDWIEPAERDLEPSYRQASFPADGRIDVALDGGRHGYLHVATGRVRVGDATLEAGDAITFGGPASPAVEALDGGQLLLFDMT
jgi:redox-sensitive bicupin YhaK (pirin superfamily)